MNLINRFSKKIQSKFYLATQKIKHLCVSFGSLRELSPVSPFFGFDRGKPIDRFYIEKFLQQNSELIRGRVLEVAENSYTRTFGGDRVTISDILHVNSENKRATIIADLTNAEHIPSDSFDCIILTQTLQFIFDVNAAINTLHRILKPGGVLLVTVPCISQISRHDKDRWGEYWRFTDSAMERLFGDVFGKYNIEISSFGNVFVAMCFLQGLAVEELKRHELDYVDPDYQFLITVKAKKN